MPKKYSEDEKKTAAEMAGDIGIPATMRHLGYPAQWVTLRNWCKEYDVEVVLDDLKSKAAEYNQFYNETELIIAMQENIARGRELLQDPALTGSEYDKIVNGMKKSTEVILLVKGKPTSRTANGEGDDTEAEFLKLFEDAKKDKESI